MISEKQAVKDKEFNYQKARLESYLKTEFKKKFPRNARISIRKRQKFMEEITRKVSKKFGKESLCLVDFRKGSFVTLVSPAKTESTDKGKLIQSFSHPQVFYTTHCIDRFSQRAETQENCVVQLDDFLNDALITYGEHEGYLTCPAGIFAYEMENDRLIVKTYINFELLSAEQIRKYYGPGMITMFPKEFFAEDPGESDFILVDEYAHLTK